MFALTSTAGRPEMTLGELIGSALGYQAWKGKDTNPLPSQGAVWTLLNHPR